MKNNLISTEQELSLIRNALDQSAIVAITDAAGKIIHVNDKFCEISKYTRDELFGKTHRIINSGYHSKDFFVDMWKTISSGHVWEGEVKNRAKDGKYYWVYTTIVPFMDNSNRPFQYVSIRFEITRIKDAEEQLRVYADKLERSNRELQDFASIAAHDLQEPLRKILTFGDRFEKKFGQLFPTEAKEYLERILSSAQRMRKLIDDLLTYARVSSKTQPFETTNLNIVLTDVLSDLQVRIESTQAKIIKSDLPIIEADASQMRQLFQNLIVNAIKFTKPGMSPHITISHKCADNLCVIQIADNGIGFEDKYAERIFGIFQRLHGKQEYEGTGVGLAVCRSIVERHLGLISVNSKPGEGTTFTITLPIKQTL